MTDQQERIQDILDDFIMKNSAEIERVSTENPLLLKSVLDVVDVLSKKYGMGKSQPIIEAKTEPVQEVSPKIKSEKEPKGLKVFNLYEIKSLSTPDKKVLTNKDGSVIYEYKDGILYDTDPMTGKRTTSYRMMNTIVQIAGDFDEKNKNVESVSETKKETEESVSIEDLKEAIKNLKPLAEFDDEVKQEIERLKQQIKNLKKKKS